MTGLKVTTFQKRFEELFEESEKTTTSLAKDLHVSNQTISAWKLGVRSPKEPTIIAIADHFGVSVAWLMGFDTEKMAKKKKAMVIPDTDTFRKIMEHMAPADYEMVMDAFNRTYNKMREDGIV